MCTDQDSTINRRIRMLRVKSTRMIMTIMMVIRIRITNRIKITNSMVTVTSTNTSAREEPTISNSKMRMMKMMTSEE
jgi:hypothetical protein